MHVVDVFKGQFFFRFASLISCRCKIINLFYKIQIFETFIRLVGVKL